VSLLALAAVAVSLAAPTHTPAVDAKWPYSVRVTSAGTPVRATITVQIVDPFGTAHPVEFGARKQNIVNHPFRGIFRDYIEFPPESRGFKLTLRFTVRALGTRRVVTYWIRSR
jgi:hypothetical protein